MDAKEIKPGVIRPAGHYRHELKYNITYWQYLQLRSRFRQVMKTDPHRGGWDLSDSQHLF